MSQVLNILKSTKVIPVVTVNDVDDALRLLEVFEKYDVGAMEITLRRDKALSCIKAAAKQAQNVVVGAGTVLNRDQFNACVDAGAKFLVSPGSVKSLLKKGLTSDIAYIPGIQTVSDLMRVHNFEYEYVKFFPAEQAGGKAFLATLHGLFPNIHFCPTGGVNVESARSYLELPYVFAVGGSWMVRESYIQDKNWQAIADLCGQMRDLGNPLS